MPGGTLLRRTATVAVAAVLLAGAFVAGRASVAAVGEAAAEPARQVAQQTVWTVREETVGRSVTLSGRVRASTSPGPVARAEGVVTSIHIDAPAEVTAGTALYGVDLRPVVAGEGMVPAFRPLAEGERGQDVVQLRGFLCGAGWRAACGGDELFDHRLTRAVRDWQQQLGVPADGVVRTGDILWFPSLPVRVRPSDTLQWGAAAPVGERPYIVDSGAPRLTVDLSREQAALVPERATAVVAGQYDAVVAAVGPAGQPPAGAGEPTGGPAEFTLALAGEAGEPFCAAHPQACAQMLAGADSTAVDVIVHIIPERTGPAVPVAAIETDAGGRTMVRLPDGGRLEVEVLTVAGGVAIVGGLVVGDRVRLP